jgi:hypothetical protein
LSALRLEFRSLCAQRFLLRFQLALLSAQFFALLFQRLPLLVEPCRFLVCRAASVVQRRALFV